MKEEKGEGGYLRSYLKKKRVNQDELAKAMGYTGRHSIIYHFNKKVLDHEFKMALRKQGINLFNENGKLDLASFDETNGPQKVEEPLETYSTTQLREKYIERLEELVETYREYNSKLKEENERLTKK